MTLSIIIVNYNVKYFLEQCLHSVLHALTPLQAEVFVVDNASDDNSIEYLRPMFPMVNFIPSEKNLGFGKANNLALQQCKGDYILFLNPDTLVAEDCFEKCLAFMTAHPSAGALGIRMIDGSGKFLPESKRAFPSASTAFYKLVGLSAIFSRSRFFNKYSLGYLDEHQNHIVDVLAGAFMLVKKEVLQKVGAFDEAFFMYGEDIDLSYRIQKAGYENWYFADSSIIHFKGESTKKGSLNYVRMFYNAMSVFVQKHYHGRRAKFFVFFIQAAIWFRAFFSWVGSTIVKFGLPILDAILIFSALFITEEFWVRYFRDGSEFHPLLLNFALPGFTLVFLAAAALAGIYDKKYKPFKAFTSAALAIIVMLAVYSLLPERFRFSRAVMLIGGSIGALFTIISRFLLVKFHWIESDADDQDQLAQTVIIGTQEEYDQCIKLLKASGVNEKVLGRVSISEQPGNAIGNISQLQQLIDNLNIKEVIFCRGTLNFMSIIQQVQQLPSAVSYKFHTHNSKSILGSDSKHASGEALTSDGYFKIAEAYQRRMKRITDCCFAFALLISFPAHLLLMKNGITGLKNAIKVLISQQSWIGYAAGSASLPRIKPAVLSPNGYPLVAKQILPDEILSKADYIYAKDYNWIYDLKLIAKNYRRLGGSI